MSKKNRAGMVSNKIEPPKVEEKKLKGYETICIPEKFEQTDEIFQVKVLKSENQRWYEKLIGETIDVIQTDFDTLFAVEYQDENKPFITYVLYLSDCEI